MAAFLVQSGICAPEDIEGAGEAESTEALLGHLVELGRLSADQSVVLQKVALSPWLEAGDRTTQRNAEPLSFAGEDFHPYWAGTSLGPSDERYTDRTQHAKGGMGRVIRAFDRTMEREVAIKELLPEVYNLAGGDISTLPAGKGANQDAIHRFLYEARITGQLEHPSIVPVYEIGTKADDAPYYTMKLVRGKSLADAIREAKTLEERMALLPRFVDLCQAIAYAHSRGVIHRDIKPSNVLLGEYGETVVIDWGLAKAYDPPVETDGAGAGAGGRERRLSDSGRTVMGHVLGTPIYMAPEQARGALDEIDERSDVYSLGGVLYEILVGVAPFADSKPDALLAMKQQDDPPPVHLKEQHAPPDLSAVCERALQREPRHRYQSAIELAEDVQRFMSGSLVEAYQYSIGQQLMRFARLHKLPLAVAAVAVWVIILIGAASYMGVIEQRDAAVAASTREAAARAEAESALAAAELARADATASEGVAKRELYLSTVGLANTLVQSGDFARARRLLAGTESNLRGWEWSWLMFQAHADEQSWPAPPPLQRQVDVPPSIDWEHGRIARHFGDLTSRQVRLYDMEQRIVRQGLRDPVNITSLGSFFLPGGETLLNYTSRAAYRVQVDNFDWLRSDEVAIFMPLEWMPRISQDRALVLFATEHRTAGVFDTSDLTLIQEYECEAPIANALLLAEGRRVLTAEQFPFDENPHEARLVLWDLDSGEVVATLEGFRAHPAAVATDGRTVALTRVDGHPVVLDVTAIEDPRPAVELDAPAARLAFAHDEPVLAVADEEGGVVAVDSETGGTLGAWSLGEAPTALAISRDGKRVAVGGQSGSVVVMDGGGRRTLRGNEGRIRHLEFDPEGESLAAVDQFDLRLWNLRTPGPVVTLADQVAAATFSREGQSVTALGSGASVGKWRPHTGECMDSWEVEMPGYPSTLMAPGGEYILGRGTMDAALLRLSDGAIAFSIDGGDFLHAPAAFSSDGSLMALLVRDAQGHGRQPYIVVYDAAAGGEAGRFPVHQLLPTDDIFHAALAFDPDGTRILLAHSNMLVEFDPATGETLRMLNIRPVHPNHGNAAAVSPDGHYFAVSGQHGSIIVTEVGGRSRTIDGHSAQVTAIAFDSTGARMVSGAADGSIKLWDMDGMREILTLPARSAAITGLEFHANCGTLLVLDRGGAAQLHHVLAWQTDIEEALPGLASEDQWSEYRRLHPILARPESRCDVAAQARLLTALGYSRKEALGVLAPLYPQASLDESACPEDHIPSNRLFIHTIAALAEKERDAGRREALANLAYDALERSSMLKEEHAPGMELSVIAQELLRGDPPRAEAAIAFASRSEQSIRNHVRSRNLNSIYGTLGRAYLAAGDWPAAHRVMAEVVDEEGGNRNILWAQILANLDGEEDHAEAAETLARYLERRPANSLVREIFALLAASPHDGPRAHAEQLQEMIEPDPSAVRALPWRASLDAAIEEAAESHAIVLAFVESTRSPERMLEAQPALSRPDMVDWFTRNTVPVLLDAHQDRGISQALGVIRLPALVAFNSLGRPIWRAESNFSINSLHAQLRNQYDWPGAIRVFDICGAIPEPTLDADSAEALMAAFDYPHDFAWKGEAYPWVTHPIGAIHNSVSVDANPETGEPRSFIATAEIHAEEEVPVRIEREGTDLGFVFVNGVRMEQEIGPPTIGPDPIWGEATLRPGKNRIAVVVTALQTWPKLRLAVRPLDGPVDTISHGPVLGKHFPEAAPPMERIDTVPLPREQIIAEVHVFDLLREWRAVYAEFMQTAGISFVEVDGWGVGVKFENASDFAVTRMLGMRDGDIIVRLNDVSFTDSASVMAQFEEWDGQVIPEWNATVIRNGQEIRVTVLVDYQARN